MLKSQGFGLIFCFFLVIANACTEERFDPNDPQKSFLMARAPYDDKSYEIALQKLGEFKARFPYSQYATEAELLIANSHFELEQFIEAAAAYESFVKLHPKHAEVDYAMFRVGESHWREAPEEIDREQDYTKQAVASWQKLLKERPKSQYTEEAKEKLRLGQLRLAESDEFIAKFYCKLEIYHACASRSLKLAEDFKQFASLHKDALQRAAKAFEKMAEIKEQDPKNDKNIYFKTMTAQEIRAKAVALRKESGT